MFADVDDTRLFYERLGEGNKTPILFFHGGLGLDHTSFRPYLDPLADVAPIIYYDHRGNGRSQHLASFEGVTHQRFNKDAAMLADVLGFDRLIVFGHSYGGFLAQEFALEHPDRLKGLILCGTAPALDYPDTINAIVAARATPEQQQAVGRLFTQPMESDEEWRQTYKTIMPLYFTSFDPEVARHLDSNTRYNAAAANHALGNCLPEFNVVDRLREIEVPTLLLSGVDDWITPVKEGGQRLKAGIPNSELIVFEKSGHWPFIEEPDRTIRVIKDWLVRI